MKSKNSIFLELDKIGAYHIFVKKSFQVIIGYIHVWKNLKLLAKKI